MCRRSGRASKGEAGKMVLASTANGGNPRRLIGLARREVENVISALPEDVRRKAEEVHVAYELAMPGYWKEDGVEPDSLGLFSGPSCADPEFDTAPEIPLISLFLLNLWDYSDSDVQTFREEVRRTYLHELGHYLGLEEDDMEQRGLL